MAKTPKQQIPWSQQYKHPNWQRKRLEAMEAAQFSCEDCGDTETTLNVHHQRYVKGRMIWEYELHELMVLCEPCHQTQHQDKELLHQVLQYAGTAGVRQAACLLGGYLDAQCALDGFVRDEIKKADPGFYEIGMAASCLENMGHKAWQEVVRKHVATRPSTPTMEMLVEAWDKGY